ncbi:MAG: DNA cytosine methyltransferase, partial [Clostridiales bacterium]|nr:DNA cytosine methyltransferase [Clostridiales bacterium]
MKHYGDITKIKGNKVPIVDIVTGGSPCQDLSIAGKRAGLDGERSGLFMEQIRIVKEMHDECRRTNKPIRPRFMVWENVPGAFSSNNGEDFRVVLEETARIIDSNASIPRLADGQTWSNSGSILGDGWSIAWRVHDAQFWGVAQRRRRVSLIADFRGQSAPEILFERSSLSRNTQQSEEKGQDSAEDIGGGTSAISFQ